MRVLKYCMLHVLHYCINCTAHLVILIFWLSLIALYFNKHHHHHHHYHYRKHQGLDPLIHSVYTVTTARANASSVFQLFSFLVICSGMISKGFGFVAYFTSVKAISLCIHLSCLASL